jgi:hypothetical protein
VVLSGADALVSAADIHKMLSSSGVEVSAAPVLLLLAYQYNAMQCMFGAGSS